MLRRLRFALRPGWLALHVVAAALIVTMVLLGRWQLTVSERKHFSLQNFGYAIQWWAFSAFVVVMWVRALRDALHRLDVDVDAEPEPVPEAPVTYRRYVMPQQPVEPVDGVHAAYNDYLSRLAAADEAERS